MISNDQMFFTSPEKLKMSSRKCKYDADAFCFICGQFFKVRDVKYELKTSHVLCESYEAYFDFVKKLDETSEGFGYLKKFLPKLSEAKVKTGVFVGPQIRQIMAGEKFPMLLNRIQKASWNSFKAVVFGFLGNNKAENYEQLVENMLKNFKAMGCRMLLKIHMLHAHLDIFKNNMRAYSEEHGERFHQDIMKFEQRYQGQYNENMMGDYIWGLVRKSSYEHKKKSKSVHF